MHRLGFRSSRPLIAAIVGLGVLGATTQAAQAQTYCVNGPTGTTIACNVQQAATGSLGDQLQAALTAAAAHAGDDTIEVGAGTYTRSGGFTSTDSDRLIVNGAGRGLTTLTDSSPVASEKTLSATGVVALRGLTIVGPTGSATIALKLTGDGSSLTAAELVGPNGPTGPVGSSSQGAYIAGGTVTDTTVAGFDIGIVISNSISGVFHLESSTVSGTSNGVLNLGDVSTINRSTVESPGMAATGAGGGLTVTNSLLKATTPGGTAAEAQCFTYGSLVIVRGSTLVGGAAAFCSMNNAVTSIGVAGSIVAPGSGVTTFQSSGGTASASIESSDWDGTRSGTVNDNGGNISADPQFVSATDFRLKATSPAIDAGPTATAPLGAVDLLGNPRVVAGSAGSAPRVDMGAYEFQPAPVADPTTAPSALPSPTPSFQPASQKATPPYRGPVVTGGTLSVDASGHLSIAFACPAAAVTRCTVTVAIKRTTGRGKKKKTTTLASGTATAAAGKSAAVALKLTKSGRKLVPKSGLKVSLVTTSTDARSRPVKVTTTTAAKIKPAKPGAGPKT